MNTGKQSWWLTSSVGCQKEILSELEKLQIQQQLDSAKSFETENSNSTLSQENLMPSHVSFNSDTKYKYLNKFVASNCLIPFYLIEIIHSSLMIFNAVI